MSSPELPQPIYPNRPQGPGPHTGGFPPQPGSTPPGGYGLPNGSPMTPDPRGGYGVPGPGVPHGYTGGSGGYPAPPGAPAPQRNSRLIALIAGIGVVVIAAVVLVVVLTRGDSNAGSGGQQPGAGGGNSAPGGGGTGTDSGRRAEVAGQVQQTWPSFGEKSVNCVTDGLLAEPAVLDAYLTSTVTADHGARYGRIVADCATTTELSTYLDGVMAGLGSTESERSCVSGEVSLWASDDWAVFLAGAMVQATFSETILAAFMHCGEEF